MERTIELLPTEVTLQSKSRNATSFISKTI